MVPLAGPALKISGALVGRGVLMPGISTLPPPPGTPLRLSVFNRGARGATTGVMGCEGILIGRTMLVATVFRRMVLSGPGGVSSMAGRNSSESFEINGVWNDGVVNGWL